MNGMQKTDLQQGFMNAHIRQDVLLDVSEDGVQRLDNQFAHAGRTLM